MWFEQSSSQICGICLLTPRASIASFGQLTAENLLLWMPSSVVLASGVVLPGDGVFQGSCYVNRLTTPLFSPRAALDPDTAVPFLLASSFAFVLTSAPGSRLSRLFVQLVPPRQDLMIQFAVPLRGCDEADLAVPMFVVVPAHKIPHPRPRGVQAGEALPGAIAGSIQRSKQRLRACVVVAYSRSPTGRGKAQVVHFAQQRQRFHRRTVVRVQHQRLIQTLLADHATLQQRRCLLATFLFVNVPANGLTAVNMLDQIQVVILAAYRRWQICNVPRPHLIRPMSSIRRRGGVPPRSLATTSMLLLTRSPQAPIKRRFRRQITRLVSQARNDLAWRQVRVIWAVAQRHDSLSFRFT